MLSGIRKKITKTKKNERGSPKGSYDSVKESSDDDEEAKDKVSSSRHASPTSSKSRHRKKKTDGDKNITLDKNRRSRRKHDSSSSSEEEEEESTVKRSSRRKDKKKSKLSSSEESSSEDSSRRRKKKKNSRKKRNDTSEDESSSSSDKKKKKKKQKEELSSSSDDDDSKKKKKKKKKKQKEESCSSSSSDGVSKKKKKQVEESCSSSSSSDATSKKKKKKKKKKHKKESCSSSSDEDSEEPNKPVVHPLAAALQKKADTQEKPAVHPLAAALQKKADTREKPVHPLAAALQTRAPSENTGVHPLAAALQKSGAGHGSALPQGDGKPMFSPLDLSKANLRKVGPPKVAKPSMMETSETGRRTSMDTVRAQAITDAKKCSKEATKIYKYLRVSGDWVARNKELLLDSGVTHVLNMAHTVCRNYHEDCEELEYLALNVIDSANESIICFLLEAIVFIEKAKKEKGCCYVHCHMGVSRSCTVVIAYVMLKERMPFKDAFDLVKKKRPVANPNAGFVAQLMEWDRQLSEMPDRPHLYRVAKHSNLDPSLVVKLCHEEVDGKTQAVTATPMEIDGRGLFLLHDYKKKKVYIWVGPRCSDKSAYTKIAKKFMKWMIDLLPAFEDHKSIILNDNRDQMKHFWAGLGVASADAREMDDSDVDQDLEKYNPEYAEVKKEVTPRRGKKGPGHQSTGKDEERYSVQLYSWVDTQEEGSDLDDDEELTVEVQWERLKNYDCDDLESKSMYVLLVHDKKKGDSSKKILHRAHIWIGNLLEGRLNEQAGIDTATAFVNYQIEKTKSTKCEKIVEHDEKESENFWDAFESGY